MLHRTLAAHTTPPWGVSEGTAIALADAFSGGKTVPSPMEQYLAGIFNHGGIYVVLFGWDPGGVEAFAEATAGPSAMRAC